MSILIDFNIIFICDLIFETFLKFIVKCILDKYYLDNLQYDSIVSLHFSFLLVSRKAIWVIYAVARKRG